MAGTEAKKNLKKTEGGAAEAASQGAEKRQSRRGRKPRSVEKNTVLMAETQKPLKGEVAEASHVKPKAPEKSASKAKESAVASGKTGSGRRKNNTDNKNAPNNKAPQAAKQAINNNKNNTDNKKASDIEAPAPQKEAPGSRNRRRRQTPRADGVETPASETTPGAVSEASGRIKGTDKNTGTESKTGVIKPLPAAAQSSEAKKDADSKGSSRRRGRAGRQSAPKENVAMPSVNDIENNINIKNMPEIAISPEGESGKKQQAAALTDAVERTGGSGSRRRGRRRSGVKNNIDTKNITQDNSGGDQAGMSSKDDVISDAVNTQNDTRIYNSEVSTAPQPSGTPHAASNIGNDNIMDIEKAPYSITIIPSRRPNQGEKASHDVQKTEPVEAAPIPEPLPPEASLPGTVETVGKVEAKGGEPEGLAADMLDDGDLPFSVGQAIATAAASPDARERTGIRPSGGRRRRRGGRGGAKASQGKPPVTTNALQAPQSKPEPVSQGEQKPRPLRQERRGNPYPPSEFSSVDMMSSLRGFAPLGMLFVLMDILKGHEEGLIHVNQLAQALAIGKPSLLAQLDNLEAAGLLRTISRSRAGRHVELLTPNMLPHSALDIFPVGASGDLLAPSVAANAPEQGGQFSQKRLDLLYRYLKEHGIEVTSIPTEAELPKVIPQMAAFMGKYLSYVRPFYETMKTTLNDGREFRYSLAKLPSRDITHTLNFCRMLNDAKFLASFTYRRAPQYSIIARVKRTPEAINFLTGGWLEHYIRDKVISILTTHPATLSLPYAFMKNPNIILPGGENFELDFLLCVGEKIFWIEAKTGEYENFLAKYSRVSRLLGLSRGASMLVSVESLPAEDNLTARYSLSCCNLDEFADVFRINLVRELQQEAVQQAVAMS